DDYIDAGAGDDFVFEGEVNWGGGLIDMFGDIPDLTIGELVNFGAGNDILDGGDGFDELNYFGYQRPVIMNFQTDRIYQNGEVDIFRNFEFVVLSDVNDIVITDEQAFSVLLQAGDDRVVNFIDNSELFGGEGIDTVDARTMQADILIDAANNRTLIDGFFIGGTIFEFERYWGATEFRNTITSTDVNSQILGGNRADTLTGGSGNDTVSGRGGNDTIRGGAGNDLLQGGDGNDTLFGAGGRNTIHGGNGNDRLNNSGDNSLLTGGAGEDVLINTGDGTRIKGQGGADRIESTGADVTASGGGGNDTIISNGNRAILSGDDGNDTLNAFGRSVEVSGNAGNDEIFLRQGKAFGGNGDDRIKLADGFTGSTANLGNGDDVALIRGTGNSIFAGAGADIINLLGDNHRAFGGNDNDIINIGDRSGAGSQSGATIQAGGGNDILYVFTDAASVRGNTGNDRFNIFTNETSLSGLSGGAGADTFHFNEFGANTTIRITDFNTGADRLDIEGLSSLGDLISLSTVSGDARLVFDHTSEVFDAGASFEVTLILEGVAAASLSDAVLL
ncbi:MAG: calcium-binding protein, partial [Pseudomonadota bacterium]